jgi:hypothetical protein
MTWGKCGRPEAATDDFLEALDRELRRIEARAALRSLLALAKGIGQLFVLEGD